MAAVKESSWLDTAISNFGSGGKWHTTWEAIEDVGKSVRDSKLEEMNNSSQEEKKQKEKDYKDNQNNVKEESITKYATKQNMIYAGVGIVALMIFMKG